MRISRSILILGLALILSLGFISCDKNSVYKHHEDFKMLTWNRIEGNKEVEFKGINIPSIEDTYDIYVSIRYTPYINVDEVPFVLRIVSPSGISKESLHTIKLKDREGKDFLGEQLGDMIDLKELVKQFTNFPEKGEYSIIISNYSPKYEITGIMDIGLEIEKSNLDYDIEKRNK